MCVGNVIYIYTVYTYYTAHKYVCSSLWSGIFRPQKEKEKKVVELFGVECGGMRAHICADDDDLWFIHLYGFLSVKKKTILDSKSKVVLLLMAPKEKGATGRQKLDGHPPPFLSSTRTFADRRPLTLLTLLFIGPASAVYPFRAVKRRERPFSSPFFSLFIFL